MTKTLEMDMPASLTFVVAKIRRDLLYVHRRKSKSVALWRRRLDACRNARRERVARRELEASAAAQVVCERLIAQSDKLARTAAAIDRSLAERGLEGELGAVGAFMRELSMWSGRELPSHIAKQLAAKPASSNDSDSSVTSDGRTVAVV